MKNLFFITVLALLVWGCADSPTSPDGPDVVIKPVPKVSKLFITGTEPATTTEIQSTEQVAVFFNKKIQPVFVTSRFFQVFAPYRVYGEYGVEGNKVTFKPDNPYKAGVMVKMLINVAARDGSTIDTVIYFQVKKQVIKVDRFIKPSNHFVNSLYVDKQSRLYYAGSGEGGQYTGFISRYFPSGDLDTTVSLGFIQEISSVVDLTVADNGNIYASYRGDMLGFDNSGIVELDSNMNVLNVYPLDSPYGPVAAVGNDIYYINASSAIVNLLNNDVVYANFFLNTIISDTSTNQLIVNGKTINGEFITATYSLDLELLWQRSVSLDFYMPVAQVLGQKFSGNYYSFAFFLGGSGAAKSSRIMRIEYTPAGELVDSVEVNVEIWDMQPCPINDAVVVRYDLPYGDRVAVFITAEFELYVTAQNGEIKFFDIRTKQEVVF